MYYYRCTDYMYYNDYTDKMQEINQRKFWITSPVPTQVR